DSDGYTGEHAHVGELSAVEGAVGVDSHSRVAAHRDALNELGLVADAVAGQQIRDVENVAAGNRLEVGDRILALSQGMAQKDVGIGAPGQYIGPNAADGRIDP